MKNTPLNLSVVRLRSWPPTIKIATLERTAGMKCRICDGNKLEPLNVEGFLFPVTSYAPEFHQYENFVCPDCGVISIQPEPTDAALADYYNAAYRTSSNALCVGSKKIDTPVDLNVGGRSMARVKNFHKLLTRISNPESNLIPQTEDRVIDFGAYQGLFLCGVSQLWSCHCTAYDYSDSGIAFARDYLGFSDSQVAKDIYTDLFDGGKARFATMLHSLEHLREPIRFLEHLRHDILAANGLLYIEVPNLRGTALCDPTHFFTYTKQSLSYLLDRGGYDVIDIDHSGFPTGPDFAAFNDEQNLICLARPRQENTSTCGPPGVKLSALRHDIRASYAQHSRGAVRRQAVIAVRETARAIYYFLFISVLERLSPRLALRIARLLKRR
jgi:hypothetical protein